MMKNLTRISVFLVTCSAMTQFTFAQGAAPSPVTGGTANSEHGHHCEKGKRLDHLAKELGLTDQQKEQIEAVFKAQHPALKAIREDKSLTPEQQKEQLKPILKGIRQQIKSSLTPEQQAKWKELRAEHRNHPAQS